MIRYRAVTAPCAAPSCRKEIAFLRTKAGAAMPVDGDSLTQQDKDALARKEEVLYRHGEHVSHFGTCPARKAFKRLGRRKKSAGDALAADAARDMGVDDASLWGDEPFGDR